MFFNFIITEIKIPIPLQQTSQVIVYKQKKYFNVFFICTYIIIIIIYFYLDQRKLRIFYNDLKETDIRPLQ